MASVLTGLQNFLNDPPEAIRNQKLGLLSNPASIDDRFTHARFLIHSRFPGQLKALFSPQHGFQAEKQDNMVESKHTRDSDLDLPVYSLYGQTRIPDGQMLQDIDTLIVDLQDVGTRVYTFIYTMAYCMEAAQRHGKKVIVLDRPNPINGVDLEGNCLLDQHRSFVGRYPIPMRHGMTIGELAQLFNNHFNIQCDLMVVPMKGWQRQLFYWQTGLPWVPPSPNLPTPWSTVAYPGQVIWEGTNVSEGRGTCQPFEIMGAPYLDTKKILDYIGGRRQTGAILREVGFEPTANKWEGRYCRGFQVHVTDPNRYKPYLMSLLLLAAVNTIHRDHFSWKQPPYEYEFEQLPVDLIMGNKHLRQAIEKCHRSKEVLALEATWQTELRDFEDIRHAYLLYR